MGTRPKAFPVWGVVVHVSGVPSKSQIWGKKGTFLKVRMKSCDQQKHVLDTGRAKPCMGLGVILFRDSEDERSEGL